MMTTQDLFRIKRIENEKVVILEDEKGLAYGFQENNWDPFSRK